MLQNLLSPTGGLVYHSRALRYRRTWKPFLEQVSLWLDQWKPKSSKLVLVGPSAGYTLPQNLLGRFQTHMGVEPDPIARNLFRLRHGSVRWDTSNYFAPRRGEFDPEGPRRFAKKYQGCAVLFCNVLGQMLPLDPQAQGFEGFAKSFKESLRSLEWASYHDRLSGGLKPIKDHYQGVRLSNEELVESFYTQTKAEISDHGTWELFEHKEASEVWHWQLRPGAHHLVEGLQKGR